MLSTAQRLIGEESGLTLVELLIVTLVASILAGIAMPAFAEQSGKARDARAKQIATSAWRTIESCLLESALGSYQGCNANALRAIEPGLPKNPELKTSSLSASGFAIIVQAGSSARTFRVKRSAKGVLTFPCTAKGEGGCPADGSWGE